MISLLPYKDKYYKNFTDSVYSEFLRLRYGLSTCIKKGQVWLNSLRKEIVDYQYNDDCDALTHVAITYMGTLSVYYPTDNTYTDPCEIDYSLPGCPVTRTSNRVTGIGLSYVTQSNSVNIIEVNSGGCITRINVNPTITINNNNNSSFTFIQDCAQPQSIWYINHNLNIIPNVWVEDCSFNDISGIVEIIDNNTLKITFSSPVAGKAYLS